jgi:pSer/pThr/pTyr-binding forkhead associated (FHA) protein
MSTNGTFVNGAAISDQRKEIASGDKIQVGETELIVKII